MLPLSTHSTWRFSVLILASVEGLVNKSGVLGIGLASWSVARFLKYLDATNVLLETQTGGGPQVAPKTEGRGAQQT